MKSKIHEFQKKNIKVMSKKIIIIAILSLSIFSCANKENSNIDQLISSKNVKV
jgi:hypothetical protein